MTSVHASTTLGRKISSISIPPTQRADRIRGIRLRVFLFGRYTATSSTVSGKSIGREQRSYYPTRLGRIFWLLLPNGNVIFIRLNIASLHHHRNTVDEVLVTNRASISEIQASEFSTGKPSCRPAPITRVLFRRQILKSLCSATCTPVKGLSLAGNPHSFAYRTRRITRRCIRSSVSRN